MMIPMRQRRPKSLTMGTDDEKREKNPAPVMIRAMRTAGAVWATVFIAASPMDPPRWNSSSILFWNWMA